MAPSGYFALLGFYLITACIATNTGGGVGTHCYDCTGFHCNGLIQKGYAGTCTSAAGKCFYRVDPNGLEYRGCADHRIWPGKLDMAYTGCRYQQYGMWHNVKVKWCFCAFELCNVDEGYLTGVRSSGNSRNYVVNRQPAPQPQPLPQPVSAVSSSNIYRYNPIRNDYQTNERSYKSIYNQTKSSGNRKQEYMIYVPNGGVGPAPVIKLKRTDVPQPTGQSHKSNSKSSHGAGNGYGHGHNHNHNNNNAGTGNWGGRQDDMYWFTTPHPRIFTVSARTTTAPPVSHPVTTPAMPKTTPRMPQTTGHSLPKTTGYHGPIHNHNNNNVNIHILPGATGNPHTANPYPTNYPLHTTEGPKMFDEIINVDGKEGNGDLVGGNEGEISGPFDDFNPIKYEGCENAGCEHTCAVEGGKPVCLCRTGFRLAPDNMRCLDYDECQYNKGGCSHECRNIIGSFTCACPTGYIIDADLRTCIDFNECRFLEGMNCDHFCENTAGSYHCSCRQGFSLNIDGKTCNDIDECRQGTHDCDQVCHTSDGSYSCSCFHGYYLAANGRTCSDHNECLEDNGGCQQRCVNTAGNYQCACQTGYQLNIDGRSCDDVDECARNNGGCLQACINTDGSFRCDCQSGYTVDFDGETCIDVNECRVQNGGCEHICENTEGSFRCSCRAGYTVNVDMRSCDSQDACLINNGGCSHICTSLLGGPRCSCRQGYLLDTDGRTCVDINECQAQNGGCAQICRNTLGSFSCFCAIGYTLNVDGRSCDDDDECGANNGNCQQICRNRDGGHVCECYPGYQLAADRTTCTDINECLIANGRCQDRCVNNDGSFTCSCTGDLQNLAADGRSCNVDCPPDFVKVEALESCYRVFSGNDLDLSVPESQEYCSGLHRQAALVNIETDAERNYLKDIMEREGPMLEGWQGWWTAGYYHSGLNKFQWTNGEFIEDHWGFQRKPFEETCVWVLQIPVYNYTYGNYDCTTRTGFICELELRNLN